MFDYSFVGSLYSKTSSQELFASLFSITRQTYPCSKVYLYADGDLTEDQYKVLSFFDSLLPIELIHSTSSHPRGLGLALKNLMEHIDTSYALRFDSDDICASNRAEETLLFFRDHPSIDVVGSQAIEFNSSRFLSLRMIREVPISHNKILKMSASRNPMNHPTVSFNLKSYVESCGYQDLPFYEDYLLWLSMLASGFKFQNLVLPLVYQNVDGLLSRRSGLKLIKGEYFLLKNKLKASYLSRSLYEKCKLYLSFLLRISLRLTPGFLLRATYNIFLRSPLLDKPK